MKANPPHAHDYPIVHRMAAIGLRPGESFDPAAMPEVAQETLRRAARDALAYIKETYRGPWAPTFNGWQVFTQGGTYGTHDLTRAVIAYAYFGSISPKTQSTRTRR